jgi:predicted GIY-YIG superfamily endonuclease
MEKPDEKLYVLKLDEGKYYVGRTTNFITRLSQHLTGQGSAFTTRYKIVDIELVRKLEDQHDEDEEEELPAGAERHYRMCLFLYR